jgi:hypothetical protein
MAGDSQRAPLEVPVPADGDNPYEAPADLRLELEGHLTVRNRLRLRAGADVTFAAAPRAVPVPPEEPATGWSSTPGESAAREEPSP